MWKVFLFTSLYYACYWLFFYCQVRFLLDNFVQIIYIYTHIYTYIYFFSGLVSKYIFVKFLNSYEPRFWSNKYYINNLYIFVQGKKKVWKGGVMLITMDTTNNKITRITDTQFPGWAPLAMRAISCTGFPLERTSH